MKALRTYDACIACLTRENLDAEWIHFEVGAIAIRDHFHILLEVSPMPEGGISDEELLNRLSATNSEAFVALVAKELTEARAEDRQTWVVDIHARFTYRMHNLSEFMKTLLQRFMRWFNQTH